MSATALITPGLFWAGGAARLPSAIRHPQRRWLCAALLSFAVGLTFDDPHVYVAFDRWTRVPNGADLCEHIFAILGVYALLHALSGLTGERHLRKQRVLTALPVVAIGASALLFVAARVPTETSNFTDHYGRLPLIAAYWSITLAYFAVSLVELAVLVLGHSRRALRPALRLGLRFVGAGVVAGVVYSVIKIVELVVDARSDGISTGSLIDRIDSVVLAVGASLVGVGLLLPAVEALWSAGAERVSDRLALLRLRRLWVDLTAAVPDVVLGDPPSLLADMVRGDASFRLYRRVIEIRDVDLAARTGGIANGLRSVDVERLRCALVGADSKSYSGPPNRNAATRDVHRELHALLELARTWRSGSPPAEQVIT